MSRDQMTPLERLAAYGAGAPIDRLPCVPIVGNTAARVIGVKVGDFRGNGALIAQAQVAAYRLFGYDIIRIFTDLYTQAEAMGAKVSYPEDETAFLAAPAITDLAELDRLRPADPQRDGQLPQHLEAMRRAVDQVGHEVAVTGAVTCPFTNASFLVGADKLARLMMRSPEMVHHLCEISLQTNIAYAGAIIDAGCTPSLTDAMSSMSVISPRQFREFSFPYLKRLIDYVHGRDRKVTLHICGKTSGIWEAMVEAGADCLSIDNDADLGEARIAVGDRVRLMGNVHPSEVMLQGIPDAVRRATLSCLAQAKDSPKGFIVASGCSLPTETPFANIHAMLDTVREAGWPVKN
ncbi:uroporphyrinogen decarboxylase family protein [Geomonas azotofigens]|uniref:uroporphyrinogen decarboxylase family protein n=1 Tax=Geomonas azotofigens TaxID=2843196 RepID=UPI001F482992|nr:uroporphyrinogen decarboxylase family protein [Geomonas azotofigens]